MSAPFPTDDNFQLQCDQLAKNLMSASGEVNLTSYPTNPGGVVTWKLMVNGTLRWLNVGSLNLYFLPAAIIARRLPQPLRVGQNFTFTLLSGSTGNIVTDISAKDVTKNITNTILANTRVFCKGVVTQAYTTKTSLPGGDFGFVSIVVNNTYGGAALYNVNTNNATSSPTIGTLIYINVKSGTLPSGWYPIVNTVTPNIFIICVGEDSTKTVTSFDFTPPSPLTTPQWCPLIELNPLYTVSGVSA